MPIAIITFDFDPLAHLPDRDIRWETIAIGATVFLAIVVAGLMAGRIRVDEPGVGRPPTQSNHLRRDDLMFVILGIVPGAIVGGRLAYVALNYDYYDAHRPAILDTASVGLSLTGAVVLGAVTGALVARLFDAPIGRWFHLAAVPMLLVLELGKAALILGGTGQGTPVGGDWATRYLGPGPWGSLGPQIPSHPSQAYEAVGVAIALAALVGLSAFGAFRARDGRVFALALGSWATVRFVVASTWRDPDVLGPFKAEQLLDLVVIGLAVASYIAVVRRAAGGNVVATGAPASDAGAQPHGELTFSDPGAKQGS